MNVDTQKGKVLNQEDLVLFCLCVCLFLCLFVCLALFCLCVCFFLSNFLSLLLGLLAVNKFSLQVNECVSSICDMFLFCT